MATPQHTRGLIVLTWLGREVENVQQMLAGNLRLARQQTGLSQEVLADRAAVDRTYVSATERGTRNQRS